MRLLLVNRRSTLASTPVDENDGPAARSKLLAGSKSIPAAAGDPARQSDRALEYGIVDVIGVNQHGHTGCVSLPFPSDLLVNSMLDARPPPRSAIAGNHAVASDSSSPETRSCVMVANR